MAQLNIPNTIDANTTADAVEVEQNFNVIQSWVNHDAVRSDGGVAMNAPLLLNAGNPTEDNHAANKNYVDALMPIGTIMMFGGTGAPAGAWHLCDGTSLAVASYPQLYAQLGVRYGGAGGTFKLPNFAARMPIGVDSTQTRFNTSGKTGGSTIVPVPSHTHTINHDHGAATSGTQSANHTHTMNHDHAAASGTTTSAGAHAHLSSYAQSDAGSGSDFNFGRPYGASGSHTETGTDTEAAHTHTVSINLPSFTGNTGTISASHTHSINLPAFTGASGAFEKKVDLAYATNGVLTEPVSGRETTTELIPKFVVVNYIIRVDPQ